MNSCINLLVLFKTTIKIQDSLSKNLFNRQSNSDHILKTVTHTCVCWNITVGSNIVDTALSFNFNLSENPVLNRQ